MAKKAITDCSPERISKNAHLELSSREKRSQFSGVALLAREGKIIFEKAYGFQNTQKKNPNKINTKFAIGSLTKQFTAVAILQQEALGRLSFDDPVVKHLETLHVPKSVTVKNLLNHTSGIDDYLDLEDSDKILSSKNPFRKILSLLPSSKLLFEPGREFEYSNTNYAILGKLLEKVSGQAYETYLQEKVFLPLQMTNTGIFSKRRPPTGMATGYQKDRFGKIVALNMSELEDLSLLPGDGALFSTVSDLFRWQEALYEGKLISSSSLRKMLAPGLGNYGFGIALNQYASRDAYVHGGSVKGFQSEFVTFPDQKAAIILLSNYENVPLRKAARQLARILFCTEPID